MKDYVLELVSAKTGFNAKLNTMREYLQAYILRTLYENKFFEKFAFIGGTALRFLYDLPRFSQDLDFSLSGKGGLDFPDIVKKIKGELAVAGYDVSVTLKSTGAVRSAMFKFSALMYEAGLSPLSAEKFSVKLEIDTNSPRGATLDTRLVNKHFLISFLTYDVPSLFSGKIHALLSRKYTKGRDFFDLGWYLLKWKGISPNILLLNNALKQTGWERDYPTADNWKNWLYEIVEKADWDIVKKDVENFLEHPADLNIFNKENTLKLIK